MVSVCMATYNGEKYVREQIDSIIRQLDSEDELIISDDGSSDNTKQIVLEYATKDQRIKFIEGPKKGVISNFQNAIINAKGDYIFLADQDDIWMPNKKMIVMEYFNRTKCSLIVHDSFVINENKEILIDSFYSTRQSKSGLMKNIYKNSYIGCCMAFDSELCNVILPIPNSVHMHDQWIGLLSDVYGKTVFIEEKLLMYRRHDSNVSSMQHYPIIKMITNRFIMLLMIFIRIVKKCKIL